MYTSFISSVSNMDRSGLGRRKDVYFRLVLEDGNQVDEGDWSCVQVVCFDPN